MNNERKAQAKQQDLQWFAGPGRRQSTICMKTYERDPEGGPARFGLFNRDPLSVVVTDIATDAIMDVEDFESLDALLDVWMVD